LQRAKNGRDFVKLVDFGVSKFNTGPSMSMTRTGSVVGTPYYMSPEQVRGQKDLDHRSDLYSAGVVLFECVTGRVPFVSQTFNELVFEIALGPVLDPGVVAPGLDPQFAAVIRKAMARELDARYQTAAEFAQAINDWMQGANVPVPPSMRAPMGSAAALSTTPLPGSAPLPGNTPFPANTPIPGNTPMPANNSNPGLLAGPSLATGTAPGSVVSAPGVAPKRPGGGLWAGVAIGTLVVGGVAFGVMRASMSGHAANSAAASAVSSTSTAAAQVPSTLPSAAAALSSAPVVVLAPSAEEPTVSASASAHPPAAPSAGVAVHHPVGPTPPAASAEKSTTTVKGRTIRTEL
jgi:serine/threonine-protein kinase